MKKFLILSLTTMLCAVTAWGHNGHTSQQSGDVAKAVLWLDDPEDPWGDPIVTTVYFSNISDALAAAASNDDDAYGHERTITLLKNVDASSTTWTDEFGEDLVFDLNGKTLAMNIIYNIWGGNKLTIKNGTFNGTLDYGQYAKGYFYLEGGTNGLAGTIACNVSNHYSTPYYYLNSGTISANLTFNNTTSNNATCYVKTLVTGNIVNGDNNRRVQLNMAGTGNENMAKITGNITLNNNGQLYMGNYSETTGTVTMNTGSTFTVGSASANVKCNLVKNDGTTSFTNGKFYSFDPSPYLESGYMAQNEGDYYSILSSVAQNMTKAGQPQYTDFMSAYNAADAGDSIVVLKGVSISGTLNLNKNVRIGGKYSTTTITINAGSDVTFNNENQKVWCVLQSQYESTLTFNAGTYKQCNITNGNVTVNGGEVTLTALTIPAGKTFTLTDGTIGGSATINVAGTLNINGGSISATKIGATSANAKLYMTAGNLTLDGNASNYAGAIYDDWDNAFVDFSLTGGTITMKNYAENNYLIKIINEATGSNVFAIQNMAINSDGQPELYPEYPGGGTAIYIGENWENKTFEISNCNIFSRRSYGIRIDGGTCTLKNNIIEAYKAVVYGMFEYSNITISSGTYSTTGDGESIIEDGNSLASITVVPSTSVALFNKEPDSKFAAEGKEFELIEGWYQLKDGPVIAIVNGEEIRKYSDLRDAFLGDLSWLINNTVNIEMQMDYNLLIDTPLEVEAGWTCNLDLNGHVLTVNGRSADKLIVNGILNIDGTDAGSKIVSQRANCFKVNEGGELNINGGTYKTTQQQSENITYQNEVKQIQVATSYIVRNLGGTVKLTNAIFDAGCYAVDNRAGNVTIKGGEYSSSASIATGEYLSFVERYHHYGYAIANAGTMSLINATVTGVHGAVICKDEKGVLDIDGCELITENSENLEDANGALVVATNSMVSVKNTKMKSPRANYAAHVGDLDEGRTFGIVNIYAGCYLTDKMYVEQATASAGELLFPMSVSENSAWYEVAQTGGYGPLPAGYEYAAVNNSGDDATNYSAGYRWKVVIEGEKDVDGVKPSEVEAQDEDPTYTIPWQKESTWVGGDVPEEHTIVTIPVDAVVVVSNSESETEAVAEQVFVSTDATLKVEEGTTLTVGDGGINIANGGQIIVEKGAVVKVGAAGLITTEEDALVIESSEDEQGIFILDPDVTENTQPKASVKVYTNSKQTSENPWEYVYQRIALPIYELGSAPANDFAGSLFGSETVFENYLFYWNTNNKAWENCLWTAMVPFKGYQLANNSAAGGVTYTFTGNLIGNNNGAYEFSTTGFDFFGNSYTAPIYLKNFLEGFANAGVEAAVWIYDYAGGNYITATPDDFEDDAWPFYLDGVTPFTEIPSMEGFILNLRNSSAGNTAAIDYTSSIWNNPRFHAPARKHAATDSNTDRIIISVKAADGKADMLKLNQGAQYSEAFDNGADASKYFAENGINLYATTANGDLSRVATSDLNNTLIGFRSNEATSYTLTIAQQQGEALVLRDKVTNATIEMTAGATYTFTQEANTTNPARFEVIRSHKVPTSVDTIENAEKTSGIYSITGQYVGKDFTTLPAGVYIVNGIKVIK